MMLQMPNISLIWRTKYVFDTDYNGKVKKKKKKLHKKRSLHWFRWVLSVCNVNNLEPFSLKNANSTVNYFINLVNLLLNQLLNLIKLLKNVNWP